VSLGLAVALLLSHAPADLKWLAGSWRSHDKTDGAVAVAVAD